MTDLAELLEYRADVRVAAMPGGLVTIGRGLAAYGRVFTRGTPVARS